MTAASSTTVTPRRDVAAQWQRWVEEFSRRGVLATPGSTVLLDVAPEVPPREVDD